MGNEIKVFRDRLLERLEDKTSWGRNQLYKIISEEYTKLLEDEVKPKRKGIKKRSLG